MSRLVLLISLFFISCSSDYNSVFWDNNPELYEQAKQTMKQTKNGLHNLSDVKALMARFNYIPEVENFKPEILVVFARNLSGNCQSAAVLGHWALGCIGIESRYVELYDGRQWSHEVTISNDNTVMITNNEVVILPKDEWKEAALTWFNPPYKMLSK